MRKITELLKLEELNRPARVLILTGLRLSCAVLTAVLLMLITAGEFTMENYDTYYIASELYRLPCGLLFLSFIGAAILQERC